MPRTEFRASFTLFGSLSGKSIRGIDKRGSEQVSSVFICVHLWSSTAWMRLNLRDTPGARTAPSHVVISCGIQQLAMVPPLSGSLFHEARDFASRGCHRSRSAAAALQGHAHQAMAARAFGTQVVIDLVALAAEAEDQAGRDIRVHRSEEH